PDDDARDERDHYVPPPPPPAPRVQPRTLGAVAALLLGLVLVFAPGLLGQRSSAGSLLLGAGLLVGGAGALVWWMRDAPPPGSGPGDGAVV
ncbi:MAG: hypothetical protein M3P93_07140, partial [Actinomycetota bacterium]|nr:hypothetical protein [Actinomycetota bacterium]